MTFKCVGFFSCCFVGSHDTLKAVVFSLGTVLSHLEEGYGTKAEAASFHSYSNRQ